MGHGRDVPTNKTRMMEPVSMHSSHVAAGVGSRANYEESVVSVSHVRPTGTEMGTVADRNGFQGGFAPAPQLMGNPHAGNMETYGQNMGGNVGGMGGQNSYIYSNAQQQQHPDVPVMIQQENIQAFTPPKPLDYSSHLTQKQREKSKHCLTCTQITPVLRGDPVSSVYVDYDSVCFGTLCGRVVMCTLLPGVATTPDNTWRPNMKIHQLAAFNDEPVKGVYTEGDCAYATVGDLHCRVWSRTDSRQQRSFRFDRKNSTLRFVLQRGAHAVIFTSGCILRSLVTDDEQQWVTNWKLSDRNSAPYDVQGDVVATFDTFDEPVVRIINTHTANVLYSKVVPSLKHTPTHIKIAPARTHFLWVTSARAIEIHDWSTKTSFVLPKAHSNDIIMIEWVDGHQPPTPQTEDTHTLREHHQRWDTSGTRFVSVDKGGVLKLWCVDIGKARCVLTTQLKGPGFFLGWPYQMCVRGNLIVFSADEGVFLVDLAYLLEAASGKQRK
eukprot:GDKI01030402.1.p1 GENE.GDKI01030402.1~~GDKI01030402.1.p1  ORF type:complete len:495 (+),score=90.68 GDKI01030402.1:1-1485(+)